MLVLFVFEHRGDKKRKQTNIFASLLVIISELSLFSDFLLQFK